MTPKIAVILIGKKSGEIRDLKWSYVREVIDENLPIFTHDDANGQTNTLSRKSLSLEIVQLSLKFI